MLVRSQSRNSTENIKKLPENMAQRFRARDHPTSAGSEPNFRSTRAVSLVALDRRVNFAIPFTPISHADEPHVLRFTGSC